MVGKVRFQIASPMRNANDFPACVCTPFKLLGFRKVLRSTERSKSRGEGEIKRQRKKRHKEKNTVMTSLLCYKTEL